jgi:HTH-type transcriptional regulator, transcriptional repressor of NAD biosynthesis genes
VVGLVESDARMNDVKRVVVTGTESTGKTQLTQQLAVHFGEPWSAEHAREYWDTHGGITAEDLDALDRSQVANEEQAAARAKRVVFFDTDLITCVLWNDLLFPGACPGWVRVEADRRARRNALYLLCLPDVPYVSDPQRCFPDDAMRTRAGEMWREALVSRDLPFVEIRGSWAERERAAVAAVEKILRG